MVCCCLRWPTRVTTHYLTTYFELLSRHFKLCTTYSKFLKTHSKFLETYFKFTANEHISKSSQHISKSSQHIRPRTPSVGREKGTDTQLLLLLSTPCCVPRVDNNYKKVLLFCPKCGLRLAANVAQGSCDVDSQKNTIETYFLAGFGYDTIVRVVVRVCRTLNL